MSLQSDIQAVIDASGAHMGVSVHHLESGEELHINGDESFPMCSVLKIPVLVEAFRQLRAGKFALDDRWELTVEEKNLGSGILTFFEDGLQPTVLDLLTLMLIISDNTATDMLIHRLGLASINRTMHELGLRNIHVVMTIRQIFESMLPSADPTQDRYALARTLAMREQPESPCAAYSRGSDNDVSTPRDMTRLLTMIFRGEVADRQACDEMLALLLKQQLNDRLPRFLPPGTRVAHKTGTLPGFRNDSGIIYIEPQDGPGAGGESGRAANHVAVTVFSSWDQKAVRNDPVAERERIHEIDGAFGRIGRLIYEAYAVNG